MKEITEEELLQAVSFVEKLVVGLADIGRHYSDNDNDLAWALHYCLTPQVFREAAALRRMLSSKYSDTIEDDENSSDLERLLETMSYWKVPTPEQLARFREEKLNG